MKDTDYMDLLEQAAERDPISTEELTAVLRGFGLEIPDGLEMIGSDTDFRSVLLSLGWGKFDFDQHLWTPTSRQVFAFDAEVYDIEHMYLNYMKGIQAISQGELTITDVNQDNSNVNWEEPSGTVMVTFCLNGIACRYNADFQGDWLDVQIRQALNGYLEQLGIEKRFYATDGSQGEIIFFCTEEWARKFEEATLCYMTE